MKTVQIGKGKKPTVMVDGRAYHNVSYPSVARLVECHCATNPNQRGVNAPGEFAMWFRWDGNRDWMRPEYRDRPVISPL